MEHYRNSSGTLTEFGELPIYACKQLDLYAVRCEIRFGSCHKGPKSFQFYGTNGRSWAFLERSLFALGLVCAVLGVLVLLWSDLKRDLAEHADIQQGFTLRKPALNTMIVKCVAPLVETACWTATSFRTERCTRE